VARSAGRLGYFGLSGERCKEVEKTSRAEEALVPENRPVRKIGPVPELTGFAIFLSFSLVFRIRAPFHPTNHNVSSTRQHEHGLMATLYYTACSGLRDEYAHVRRKATPSNAIALNSGLQLMGSNAELRCAYKQKGEAFLQRKTNTLCCPPRQMIFQEGFCLGIPLWICNVSCLLSDPNGMAVHPSNPHKADRSKAREQSPLPDCSSPYRPMTRGDLI